MSTRHEGSVNDNDNDLDPKLGTAKEERESSKKRKTGPNENNERPPRRALSCTECKRRKTKDCKWEGLTPNFLSDDNYDHKQTTKDHSLKFVSSSTTTPLQEVDALRRQVDRLEQLVNTLATRTNLLPTSTHPSGLIPISARNHNRPFGSSDDLESAAISLEHFVVGPGVRPGLTESINPDDSLHHQHSGLSSPSHPSNFPLKSLFTTSSIDPTLLTALPQLLPNSPVAQYLVESFIDGPIHKTWHVFAQQAFRSTLREYALVSLDDLEKILDPVWFAVYLMTLAFSIKFGSPNIDNVLGFERHALPSILQKASVRVLEASDYLSRPQIGHIQVSILYLVFLFVSFVHLDSAITTAQWLELDTVRETLPPALMHDIALQALEPAHQVEICKQLYHLLNFMDGSIFKRAGLWRLAAVGDWNLDPQMAHSKGDGVLQPKNLNDLDFDNGADPEEHPYMTEASISRTGSAFAGMIQTYETQQNNYMPFERMMAYSKALKKLLNHMPDAPHSSHGWMMNTLACSMHYRLIKIHRPTMIRGYDDDEWRFSTLAAVASARKILDVQQTMAAWPELRPGFMMRWIIGSVTIVSIDSLLRKIKIPHMRDQANSICIGTFAHLKPAVTAILDTVDHFAHERQVPKEELDVDAFFRRVKDTLTPDKREPDAAQAMPFVPSLDIDQFLSNFDQDLGQGGSGFGSGSGSGDASQEWMNADWGLM
ncbi:uncharacterized protein I303_108683 [Kwoniella dejecticola CBS 10117]|uniref:Transcription factor domain-containing protein n=1 Tax=Kwoniella dejecticola CBS 10117 TaxID=1296121 RepID=A0AAJ8MJS9_9TREE